MEWNTIRVLEESPGITTTLVHLGNSRERFVLRRLDLTMTWPWSRQWLEGELEAIRRARLPHVVAPQMAHNGRDHVDVVRPYIVGLDIREWSAVHARQSPEIHLKLMCDLFYALARLHRMGIAHGGLKPANILLVDGSGELVLLDASVTRTQLAPATPSDEIPEGRPLLPERPGLAHPTAGFTADLYAAGWLLLESLAETNRTASAMRRVHAGADRSTQLSQLIDIVGVQPALRPIFLNLLDRGTENRYETAEDVLAALEAILATTTADGSPVATGGASVEGGGSLIHAEPPLVGREHEQRALLACVDRAAGGTGSVICLSGESGMGKTRLLDAVAAHAEARGVTVLRAGAFDHAPARPLGLFAGPCRAVTDYLSAHPLAAERVRDAIGALLPAALDQVPELAEALGDRLDSEAGFADSTAGPVAVAQLLSSVFTEEQPGLIVLDDCQWADDLSWRVLARLGSAISNESADSGSGSHVSLIFSCRPEAIAQVMAWGSGAIEFLDLGPLSDTDTTRLIRSVGGDISAEVFPYVADHSHGNPLDVLLIFQALVDASALTCTSGHWVVDEDRMAALPPQPLLRESSADSATADARTDVLVSPRLSRLSPRAAHAVRQGAVLGRRFSSQLLSGSLKTTPPDVEELLREAIERGIVRGVTGEVHGEYEFAHDRLREAVLRTLTAEARSELHLQAAYALEAGDSELRADYEIAYHFDRAGRADAAAPFALCAGEAGLRRNALDVAERNFKIAAAGMASCESPDYGAKLRVYEGLGAVHMLSGSYDLAAKELAGAHELAETCSALDSARIATLLGELAFKTGRFDDAEQWMQRSLRDLKLKIPRNSPHAALLAVSELCLLVIGWCSRRLRGRRVKPGTERDRLAAHIHTRRTYEWWFIRSPIWVVLGVLRSARFAQAAGGMRERAQAHSSVAVLSGTAPILAPLALRLADRSLRLRQSAGDGWGIAQSHHFRGFVLYAANRYDEAIEAFDTAIAEFDIYGDRWEQVAAMWQKALCLARQGHLHEAGMLARDTYWESKRRGDRIGAGTALAIWVQCLPGDVNLETISRELRLTAPSDRHTLAMLHAARGWRLFHTMQHAPALDAFRQADELIRASRLRNHFLAPVLTAHVQVLRLTRVAGPEKWTQESAQQDRIARQLLARARRSAFVFRAERPPVFREWALMSFSRGHAWRGRLLLRAAARCANRMHAQGELAACSLVAARVGLTPRRGALGGLPSATAAEQCRALGIHVHRAIVESALSVDPVGGRGAARHQALLDAVSSIVASDDVPEVLDKLREATFATTPARRVEISADVSAVGEQVGVQPAVPAGVHEASVSAGDAAEMKVTERLTARVIADGSTVTSVVAAYPLGEGETHKPTLEVLAALAGAVIERQALRRESMERMVAVQEAERGRIARDLHDEFGHLFASVTERLSALDESADPTARQTATEIRDIVRDGIQVARSVAWSLRPSGLDDLGLIGCVEEYVEDCRTIYPMRIELNTTPQSPPVSPTVATAVFRIVQEALTNVGRHSGASEASVMIVTSNDAMRAVIEDNGRGFDVESAGQTRSLGLIGMRDRAQLIGGRLSVESRPGHGTTIMAEVPIRS